MKLFEAKPGDHHLHLQVAGMQRTCLLHLPPNAPPPLPLVVMLHGRGGTGAWSAEELGLSEFADRAGFAAVYPDALPPNSDKNPNFITNPPVWEDSFPGRFHPRNPQDVRFIEALMHHLEKSGCIDSHRCYLTGFSNGASFAFRLAVELGSMFAALAPVAGLCWADPPRLKRPIPTIYLIGTHDPLIPLAGGKVRTPWGITEDRPTVASTLQRWAGALGVAAAAKATSPIAGYREERYSGPNGAIMKAGYVLNLGHHWPGGRGALGTRLGGAIVQEVEANQLIWDFFTGKSR